jgi:hypothetical protein
VSADLRAIRTLIDDIKRHVELECLEENPTEYVAPLYWMLNEIDELRTKVDVYRGLIAALVPQPEPITGKPPCDL